MKIFEKLFTLDYTNLSIIILPFIKDYYNHNSIRNGGEFLSFVDISYIKIVSTCPYDIIEHLLVYTQSGIDGS